MEAETESHAETAGPAAPQPVASEVTAGASMPTGAVVSDAEAAAAPDLGRISLERDAALVGANPDHDGSPGRIGWLGTLAGHVTLAVLILAAPAPEAYWSGGSDGDGIEVEIVSSRQLADTVTTRARPDQTASEPTVPAQPPPPPKPEETALLQRPEPAEPPDADAVTLDVAPLIAPAKPIETADRRPAPTPQPLPTETAPERPEPPAPAAEASSGAQDRIASNVTGAARLGTVSTLTVRASQGEIAAYSRTVLETLDRAKPRGTKGLSGTVSISFVVDETGGVGLAFVDRSSGSSSLDALALESVRTARFPAPPAGLPEPDRFYRIPITFR